MKSPKFKIFLTSRADTRVDDMANRIFSNTSVPIILFQITSQLNQSDMQTFLAQSIATKADIEHNLASRIIAALGGSQSTYVTLVL